MEFFNPSLLSEEDLIKILEDRNLKIPNLRHLTKNELIKIYEKFALPLGQRQSAAKSSPSLVKVDSATIKQNSTQKTSPNRTINLKRGHDQISKLNLNTDNENAKSIKLDQNGTSEKTNSDLNKLNVQKRLSLDENSCSDDGQVKTKRPKITWP